MQAGRETQVHQHSFMTSASEPQRTTQSNGPTPILPELLHFVGGGKAGTAPTINALLPVGKW